VHPWDAGTACGDHGSCCLASVCWAAPSSLPHAINQSINQSITLYSRQLVRCQQKWYSTRGFTKVALPTQWASYITYKLCLFMHHIHIGQTPQYQMSDRVSTASEAGGRYRLRSTGSAAYVLPRTRTKFGERGFFYSGPAAWNTLSPDLHDITDTSTFRKRLKNVVFDRAYHWLLLALLDVSYSGALQILRWLIDWLICSFSKPHGQ